MRPPETNLQYGLAMIQKNKVEVGNFGVVSVCCKYLLISVLHFLRVVCLKNKLHLPFLRVIFRHFSRLAVRSMKRRSSFRSVFQTRGCLLQREEGGHVIFLFSVYDLERTKAVIFSVSLETDI